MNGMKSMPSQPSVDGLKPLNKLQPSASIVLLSSTNQVLLLHRVRHSRSFPSAHVFPGGNLSPFHEGELPDPASQGFHADGRKYRLAAIRETFEETGILLARRKGETGGRDVSLLHLSPEDLAEGRKAIHNEVVPFEEWVDKNGGVADVGNLIPFTRWITPRNIARRFTTQMYLYMLPLLTTDPLSGLVQESVLPAPAADGGLEHTAAIFADPQEWLAKAKQGTIIAFPPQIYLLTLVVQFLAGGSSKRDYDAEHYALQRRKLIQFLNTPQMADDAADTRSWSRVGKIPWADKVISPRLLSRADDGTTVLALDSPGPELKGAGKGGDYERVVLAQFTEEGPKYVRVGWRKDFPQSGKARNSLDGGGGTHL